MPTPPSIIAHGIDLVDIERFARLLDAHPDRAAARLFTPEEIAYADARPKRRIEHLAARFAAKEATMKALGTGWAAGIGFADIEVRRADEGPPALALHHAASEAARRLGIARWLVSLSHTDSHAIASVIACAE